MCWNPNLCSKHWNNGKANYRTLYPNESELKQEENSSKAVIGTLPAHAASLATNEAIRFLVNGKSELKDKLLCIDLTTLNIQIGIKKYKYKKTFSLFLVSLM